MRKRILLVFFMILTTFALAGCDWFTTALTTTTSEITTTTTTTTPSSTDSTVSTNPLSFTISFEENGGSAVDDITQESGSAVLAPAAPSRTGYTFVGWFSDVALTTAYTFGTMPSSNLTLYAKWQINQYTMTFSVDGGTTVTAITQDFNTAVTPPTTTKTGYTFVNWYTEAALTNVYTFGNMPAQNLTLYAKWQINQYTMTFSVDGGTTVTAITQDFNTAVTAPTTTKLGYTFVNWYTEAALTNVYTFGNMPAQNLTLYAKWQINQYTVTFYDDQGTIIETQLVNYGENAVAPENPQKVGFIFQGWDAELTNITAAREFHPIFSGHYQPLVDLIISMWGEEPPTLVDIDHTIEILMFVMGSTSEEETYTLTNTMMSMLPDLMSYTTLIEFQTWFASLPAAGFDKDQMIHMMVAAVLMMVNENVNEFNVQNYLDNIAYFENEKSIAEAALLAITTEANAYCETLLPEQISICKNYFDVRMLEVQLEKTYNDKYYNETWYLYGEDFNYNLYYGLEWLLYDYFVNKYDYQDNEFAAYLWSEYQDKLALLSAEELAMYQPILDAYIAWKTVQMSTARDAAHAVMPFFDGVFHEPVMYHIENYFVYPSIDLFYQIQSYEWMIDEEVRWMNEEIERHAVMVELRDYLWTEAGTAKLTILGTTVYDMLAGVIEGFDADTFDLLFGLLTGTIDPSSLDMSAEAITDYALKIAGILRLFTLTIDQSDVDNLVDLSIDLIAIFIKTSDMTVEEQAEILLMLETALPYYLNAAGEIYFELIDLLEGLTPEKVQLVLDFINYIQNSQMEQDPYSLIIELSKLIDAFLYDGTFDISLIIGYVIEGYYTVETRGNIDVDLVAAVKDAFIASIDQMILLAHDIKDFDPENLSVDDMIKMYELQHRAQHLFEVIIYGDFSDILEPYDYLDVHNMFVRLIDPWGEMDYEQVEALIDVIMTTFGFDSEIRTLFTIMSIVELREFVININSIEDVQELYYIIYNMGYDNETIASMLTTFLVEYSDYMVYYVINQDEIDFIQQMYDLSMNDYWVNYFNLIDLQAMIDNEISLMSEPMATDVANVWAYFLTNRDLEDQMWQAFYDARNNPDYYYFWDDYIYFDLVWMLDLIYRNYNGFLQPWEKEYEYQDYLDYFNSLSSFEQQMYGNALYYAEINYNYHWSVYYPAFMALQINYPGATVQWTPLPEWIVYNIQDYIYYEQEMNYALSSADYYYWILQDLYEKQIWVHIHDFLSLPANVTLVEEVALILLDEIVSLIMYEDTDTYNVIIGLMSGTLDPSTLDLSAAGIMAFVNAGEDFLLHFLSSIDEADKAKIVELLQKIAFMYAYSQGLPELEADALYSKISTGINYYFYGIFQVKTVFTNFLATLSTFKIQTVMDNIAILDSLPQEWEYLPGEEQQEFDDNIIRAVSIASIIDVLLTGDTLDTDFLIEMIIHGYFDFEYGFVYDGEVDVENLTLILQTLLADIIIQAAIVSEYDLWILIDEVQRTVIYDDPLTTEFIEGLTTADLDEIDAFRVLIEELMFFLNNGPENYYPIT